MKYGSLCRSFCLIGSFVNCQSFVDYCNLRVMGWSAILLAISLVRLSAVSSGKSDILKTITTKSWMSRENFTSLIEASYNTRQCANIFICDESAATERLFKEFISIYPFAYYLNNNFYDCNSNFVVAESVETFLPVVKRLSILNFNTEMLIVIDDAVEEPTGNVSDTMKYAGGLFEIDLYADTNVNIATRNGLWTLSDNYYILREFRRVTRYDDMVHATGIGNLHGQTVHATTFYYPPLCFLQTTVNRTVDGVEAEFFVAKDELELDGVELLLFLMIAERMNFTYTIRKPSSKDPYGQRVGDKWKDGVFGQMYEKQTHVAFGGLWLTEEQYRIASMTSPWTEMSRHFLVPRPKPHASFWALTTPLSPEVWAATIIMIIAQSLSIYARAWVNPKIPKRFRNFTITWTEMMARLLATSAPSQMQELQLGLQFWHFIGVLWVTAYCSSLAARLASRDYDKRIDSLKDFVAANLTWGTEGHVPPFSEFFDLADPDGAQIPSRFEIETNDEERHQKILQGNYAIIGALISSTFFSDDTVINEDLKGYRLMRDSIGHHYVSFMVSPWLEVSMSQVVQMMCETGLVQYHVSNVLHRRMSPALREVLIEHDFDTDDPRILELTPLGAGFALYLACIFISCIVFCLELRSVRGARSIREVLLDIKKNREIWRVKELRRKQVHSTFRTLQRRRYGFDAQYANTGVVFR